MNKEAPIWGLLFLSLILVILSFFFLYIIYMIEIIYNKN
nr:MAG TPA: hypothetical protein [Caudoviricetes sp.]